MKRRTFISSVTAAGILATSRPGFAQPQAKTDIELNELLSVTDVPAIAVAGIINGRPFQRVAGVKSVTDKVPVIADTLFPAASLSKPVFAWAVRDLVRQGKLEWSKPLQDYADLGLTADAKLITAEHALTHSSGLPNWRFQANQQLTPGFPPGRRWQYSGEGIFLLQRVVEKITGVPIAAYMKKNVLEPLGMTSSTYAWSPALETKAVSGHDRRARPLERSSVYYEKQNYDLLQKAGLQPESASYAEIVSAYEKAKAVPIPVAMSPNMAGSLWTTAIDYPKFITRVLADLPSHTEDFRARVEVNPKIAWALGWGVDRTFQQPALFHWGDGPGFKNFTWIQPERKTALVFFTNGDHGQSTYSYAFRQLLKEDPASLMWI
jgi:CubicO group peptidase (beta-lactamase class C family)